MKLRAIFLVCLCLLLIFSLADARKKRDGKRKKGRSRSRATWKCESKYWHSTTAEDLQKKLTIGCKKNQNLTSIALIGQNGVCKGLTPDLFVQMNRCYWKQSCTFSYDVSAPNYMLKLFAGNASDCVIKHPETFTFSYECTHKKATLLELPVSEEETHTLKAGIIRSHTDHPWLYKRTQLPKALTLVRPKPAKRHRHFVFTMRSLNLVTGDNLTISTGNQSGEREIKHTFDAGTAVALSETTTHVIKDVKDDVITVSLNTSPYTNGSEGFVMCFRWMRWKSKYEKKGLTACRKLLLPKKCKAKKG